MEEKALDTAPVWSDLVTFDGKPWRGKVDILSAGYPCQPFSQAGKRLGEKDPRHLWPHVRRILGECGAPLLFAENVPGHVSLGLEAVWKDLREMGYEVEAGIFSAAEVGAPHIRKRLFILAYADHEHVRDLADRISQGWSHDADTWGVSAFDGCGSEGVDNALAARCENGANLFPPLPGDLASWERYLAFSPDAQPAIFRGSHGLAYRMDRYRLTGNGVVPLAAGYAFGTLALAARKKLMAG
jgi:DNA (cytosine-5)-methyltransferase 1